MATIPEIETALINADRAGDTAAAQALARELRTAQRMRGLGGPTASVGDAYPSQSVGYIEPSPLERFGRGMKDVPDSVKQGYLSLTNPQAASEFQKQTDSDIARYEKGRGPNAGVDWMRMAGTTAMTLPATGATTLGAEAMLGAKAAGPIARTVLGAATGAEQGALTWTPEGQSKLRQVGLGAASGALAPWMSDAVGYVVSKAKQFGQGAAARFAATPDSIVAELQPVLEKQGVKWGDLTDEVRQTMLAQARRQLTIEGDLSPDALGRKLEMDDLMGPGAGPTRGQVLRDPAQWTWERNAQKLPGDISEPLTTRYQAQIQRLQDLARQAKEAIGGQAKNPYQAGDSATTAVQQKLADSQRVVGDLYKVWRESGAGGTEVKAAPIADALGKVADEIGTENIPPAVQSRLKEFGMLDGKQTKLLTIDEAEKLRRLIGNNDPKVGPGSAASAKLREALDSAVLDTNAPELPQLQAARAAARERFGMRDSSLATIAASEDAAPDRFFNRYVLNGNVRDLQGLKTTLNTGVMGDKPPPGMDVGGTQAWKDLKGQVIDYAAQKAQSQGEGSFSGKAFRKALDEIGDERLKVLFEPAELADLKKLDRVAYNLTAEPNLAAVGHSNTAAAGAQYVRDFQKSIPRIAEAVTNIPVVGKMAAGAWAAGDQMAQQAEMRRRVGEALMGDAFNPRAANDKYRELAQLISGRLTPYVGTAGVAGAEGYTR